MGLGRLPPNRQTPGRSWSYQLRIYTAKVCRYWSTIQ